MICWLVLVAEFTVELFEGLNPTGCHVVQSLLDRPNGFGVLMLLLLPRSKDLFGLEVPMPLVQQFRLELVEQFEFGWCSV